MVTDDELRVAVSAARSWRDTLRRLGLNPSSAGLTRSLRRRAADLHLDSSHFTGQRRWNDAALRDAVAHASSWPEVMVRLGLSDGGGGNLTAVRGHAARLSLPVEHLGPRPLPAPSPLVVPARVELLRAAAGSVAAAWFLVRGYTTHWPQEPCRYDLVVEMHGRFERIQVKTTTRRTGGSHQALISSTRQDSKAAYDVDDLDHFFVVDDDLDAYLIPIAAVAGLQTITLRRYARYRVMERGDLLSACASPGP